jgi:hypothetical protein
MKLFFIVLVLCGLIFSVFSAESGQARREEATDFHNNDGPKAKCPEGYKERFGKCQKIRRRPGMST